MRWRIALHRATRPSRRARSRSLPIAQSMPTIRWGQWANTIRASMFCCPDPRRPARTPYGLRRSFSCPCTGPPFRCGRLRSRSVAGIRPRILTPAMDRRADRRRNPNFTSDLGGIRGLRHRIADPARATMTRGRTQGKASSAARSRGGARSPGGHREAPRRGAPARGRGAARPSLDGADRTCFTRAPHEPPLQPRARRAGLRRRARTACTPPRPWGPRGPRPMAGGRATV